MYRNRDGSSEIACVQRISDARHFNGFHRFVSLRACRMFCDGSVGGDTVFTANVSQMKDVLSYSKKKIIIIIKKEPVLFAMQHGLLGLRDYQVQSAWSPSFGLFCILPLGASKLDN